MYAKVFSQIFDSSIASDHIVRHVFMDMLVLADRDGVVDMTTDAIARRTNVPIDVVCHAINVLGQPDPESRSGDEEGRRIVPIDSHRSWGWQIVNYEHYRDLRDEESRRAYFRDKKREQRERQSASKEVKTVKDMSNEVKVGQRKSSVSTEADTEAYTDIKAKTSLQRGTRLPEDFSPDESDRVTAASLRVDLAYEFEKFRDYFIAAPGQKGVKTNWHSTLKNWLRTAAERGSKNPLNNGHHPVNPDRYKREPLF